MIRFDFVAARADVSAGCNSFRDYFGGGAFPFSVTFDSWAGIERNA